MQNELFTNYFNPPTPIWTPTPHSAPDKKSIMKWKDFIKKYPNYSRYRFSADNNGFVSFIFNGDEYTPINADGTFNKEIFHFPHDGWPAENIHTFLNSDDKKTFEKELATSTKVVVVEKKFPQKYRINSSAKYKFLSWESNPSILNYYSFDIFITPKEKTHFTFRNIFKNSSFSEIGDDLDKYFNKPNFTFWVQALNFAVWCATGGCGVSKEMLTNDQIGSFYKFHVYFTSRRILNELQCPLPNDKNFKSFSNFYNKTSAEKLMAEFNTPTKDFRFYGNVDVLFLAEFMHKIKNGAYQYEWFSLNKSDGLTQAGLSRINQSIEAFVYCILGSQVQTRSGIIGDSGSAEETKQVFLKLFESAVVENDISKSIQRYQFALQQAKQKLDLVIALDCWLSPSNLVLNTSSIAGYNNKLQKATETMKLGINKDINKDIIPSVKHNLGPSKKNHLPIEKPTVEKPPVEEKPPATKVSLQKHDNNKAAIIITVAGVAWFLFR